MNGSELHWLEEQELEAIHQEVIAASGGLAGIRDRGLLASALVAPKILWHYAPESSTLLDLAARLAMDWRRTMVLWMATSAQPSLLLTLFWR